MIIALLLVFIIAGLTYIAYKLFTYTNEEFPEKSTTHLPHIEVKESDYIKQKREECINKYKNKLLATNPERKVDLCNPTILTTSK